MEFISTNITLTKRFIQKEFLKSKNAINKRTFILILFISLILGIIPIKKSKLHKISHDINAIVKIKGNSEKKCSVLFFVQMKFII